MGVSKRKHIVIVGGGFGGLEAAKALRSSDANVVIVDRQNHHVFQPLLYQVATASLSPSDISVATRAPLRRQKNCGVVLDEVQGVNLERRRILVASGSVEYDYLVLAAGATHAYFGRDDWAKLAPGLKTLADATDIRRRLLLAFEAAEHEGDEDARRAALTFVVVGAGPTGVELAGAIQEIASHTLPEEYRNIDTSTARVILVEGGERILQAFPPESSAQAQRDLEELGVEVLLGQRVTNIQEDGVQLGDTFIGAYNVFWAAGVQASPLGKALGVPTDRAGRVCVEPDLSIAGHPEVFVIGDMASIRPPDSEQPVPGVAQGAIQMGRYAGRVISEELIRGSSPTRSKPFKYVDKGSMAIIGRNRAVAVVGSQQFSGFFAWLLWAVVHILFIVGFRNRFRVLLGWAFNWFVGSRDSRLIVGDRQLRMIEPQGPGYEAKGSPADGT
ncbi:MAG: NAD(P)/FAD-dependent oxidoreductase [Myxococcota bacterium]